MIDNAFIYLIERGQQLDSLSITECTSGAPRSTPYSALVPMTVNGTQYIYGYSANSGSQDVYTFIASPPLLRHFSTNEYLPPGRDIFEFFMIGNLPYLVAYTQKSGEFEFYAVKNDASLSKPYLHFNFLSSGYTTLKAFTYFGRVGILAYNSDTGAVAIYNVSVTATSSDGVPPLQQNLIWKHGWSKGWVRFVFFELGGENFFLKTNTSLLDVNIDHILDDPKNGTSEVASELDLTDALLLDMVESFRLPNGEVYFLTYRKDTGQLTFNRVHADCLGWTEVSSILTKTGACHAFVLQSNVKRYLVVV